MPPESFTELSHFELDLASVRLLGNRYCLKRYVVVLGKALEDPQAPIQIGML